MYCIKLSGVYYVPGRRQRSECHIKPKLAELTFKVVATRHPMQRVADAFAELAANQVDI
jgi:hypothetical protein